MKSILIVFTTFAAAPAQASHWASCKSLENLILPEGSVSLVQHVPAGVFSAPDGRKHDVPEFCRIAGVVTPASGADINFEVWLPAAEKWNGRYYQHGEGSSGGKIDYSALAGFVTEGATGAATDDGFKRETITDRSNLFTHLFVGQSARVIEHAYGALKVTTDNAKSVIRAYYGKAARHSYFEGCSGGGSYAWQAAQRFPEDWDGFLIGAPANNALGYFAASAWNGRKWLDPEARIPTRKLPAIQRAALASCSPQAHVLNGIAADPRFCRFDPAKLACSQTDTDDCLTQAQIRTLRNIYSGPRNPRTGEQLYPGFPPTTEVAWAGALTTDDKRANTVPFSVLAARIFYRYALDDLQWDANSLNFDSDLSFVEQKKVASENLKSVMNATDPDWSLLQKRGTKILMYFGWGDQALTPLEGISYYGKAIQAMGGIARTQDFFRLFLVPGMLHCGKGPGANSFGQSRQSAPALKDDAAHDTGRALEAWVENGREPNRIVAAKYINDDPASGVAFTRPLCPYPQIAVYSGSGDTSEALNFACIKGAVPKH